MAKRTRGERAGLTRALVLDAAVALVDRDGLDGLSMHKLGAALGVETMTLYHHVPSKAALLDGLVEWVQEQSGDEPVEADLSWDDGLRCYAETLRATLLRHPGVLPLFFTRPAVTPRTLRDAEQGLRVLRDAGFTLTQALDVLNALQVFVVGHAMAEAGAAAATARGAGSVAALDQVDLAEFPLVMEAGQAIGDLDPDQRFGFGLDALLAGFARSLPIPDQPATTRRDGTRRRG